MALKREGTATEHVFKIHIGSASQGVLMLLVEERCTGLIYLCVLMVQGGPGDSY